MKISRTEWWITALMLFVAGVVVSNAPYVEGAEKKVLYPYKMILESTTGFDSTVVLTDNEAYANANKAQWEQGLYPHTWRTDHRDSVKGLVFDTTDFYFDIKDCDAGAIGYGVSDYTVVGEDSVTHFFITTAALGTEICGLGFVPIRYISLKEHGAAGTGADTYTDTTLGISCQSLADSLALVNFAKNIVGGTDADSSWMRVCDKLRLRILDKDSSQVNGKVDLVAHTFKYRAFMIVRNEY